MSGGVRLCDPQMSLQPQLLCAGVQTWGPRGAHLLLAWPGVSGLLLLGGCRVTWSPPRDAFRLPEGCHGVMHAQRHVESTRGTCPALMLQLY